MFNLSHFEAGVLDNLSNYRHDLGGELPLLLPEGGPGRVLVLQPGRQEHVVGRGVGENGGSEAGAGGGVHGGCEVTAGLAVVAAAAGGQPGRVRGKVVSRLYCSYC